MMTSSSHIVPRSLPRRRRIWQIAGVFASVAVIIGATLALTRDARSASTTDPAAVARVAADLPRLVGAFDRVQGAEDRLPGDPVADLEALGDAQPGESPLMARRLNVAGGSDVYLWPKSDGACFSSPGPAGCFHTKRLAEQGAILATSFSSESTAVQVLGVVASGVREVRFRLDDGSRKVATVQDQGFFVVLPSDPISAHWVKPDGGIGALTGLVSRP